MSQRRRQARLLSLRFTGPPPPPCGPGPARSVPAAGAPPRASLGPPHLCARRGRPHFLQQRPGRSCGSPASRGGLGKGLEEVSAPPRAPQPRLLRLQLAYLGPARGQRGALGPARRLELEPRGGPRPPPRPLPAPPARRPGRRRGPSERGAGQTAHGQAWSPPGAAVARALPPTPLGAGRVHPGPTPPPPIPPPNPVPGRAHPGPQSPSFLLPDPVPGRAHPGSHSTTSLLSPTPVPGRAHPGPTPPPRFPGARRASPPCSPDLASPPPPG